MNLKASRCTPRSIGRAKARWSCPSVSVHHAGPPFTPASGAGYLEQRDPDFAERMAKVKRGIHLWFRAPIYATKGVCDTDLTTWQRGGERLNCRSEMRMWSG